MVIVSGKSVAERDTATTRSLDALQALNPDTAWAWGYQQGSFTLLKTMSGGRDWHRIPLPLQPPHYDSENAQAAVSVYFLNERYGWIGWIDVQTSSLQLLKTADGGQHWQHADSPVPPNVTLIRKIEFVTPDTGWILYLSQSGLSGVNKFLYASQDGGNSWHSIMSTLPYPGTRVNIHFLNATDGWITIGNPASSNILLFRTTDGGKTWENMDKFLPVPKSYKKFNALSASSPVFSGPHNLAGIFSVNFYAENQHYPVLYHTGNGGETWSPIVMKGFANATVNRNGSPAIFINATDGWSLKNSNLYSTNNSGRTWRVMRSKSLKDVLDNYPTIRQLDFVTRQVGWILLESKDDGQSQLLKTTDGGSTWSAQ